ncbi:MAG: GNAT family N-acetyltransferase [Actinomycetota bacterium]|nr:GNAT family N-acetyltransferase [Actinomycetota bacterium]
MPIALRPWNPSDVEHLLRIFVASKDLSTQYPQSVVDLAGAERCLETMLAWEDHRHNFAITVAGAAVGNVGVTAIERRHHTGWVSYFSSGVVRGQRLVSRSATAVANWALTDLGLFRLELGHRVNNPASGRIAVAAGFMLEGCERQKLQYDDERFDVLTYGRLATDPAPVVDAVTIVAEI